MSHAVVLQVKLVGDRREGMRMLDEHVIPGVQALEGFERGVWMHNQDMAGTAVIVFDTQAHADAAVAAVQPPPGGPTVTSCVVYEIAREV